MAAAMLLGGAAEATIAYTVPNGTAGTQTAPNSLGMDFNVLSKIEVTSFGVFDDNSDGLNLPITARLYDRSTQTQVGPALTFSGSGDPLVAGHRFQDLATPIVLPAGFQGTMVGEGYGSGERNGNSFGSGNFSSPDTGAVLLDFVGTSRFGTAGAFPATADGGGPARYGAGTFQFRGVHDMAIDNAGVQHTGAQSGFSALQAVDGLGITRGWAIAHTGGDGTSSQSALFPLDAPVHVGVGGMPIRIFLDHQDASAIQHALGYFKLSATDDQSPSFASTWSTLNVLAVEADEPGVTFTIMGDNSVLVGGANPNQVGYSLVTELPQAMHVSAFRLDAIDGNGASSATWNGLPTGGPGRWGVNGNFVLTGFRAEVMPEPGTLSLLALGGLGVLARRRRYSST
jgi:hypothetical protein